LFPEDLANRILRVPLSRNKGDDFANWPHTRCGIYSVRSAYNLARTEKFVAQRSLSGHGLSTDHTEDSKLWKKLWSIKAPGKMKILLWRFAHDCLPSGHQLCRRQIPASDACLFCNREERVEHTLLFCPYAREVWRLVKAHIWFVCVVVS
jgi:hypothetical protein